MEHAHHWRATSKVFALVCECGVVYHDWLVAEIDRLKKSGAAPVISAEEVAALRAQLEAARTETATLRAELDEAKRELETRAQQVMQQIATPT